MTSAARKAEPTPLDVLRASGPHAGYASLSAELCEVWESLPTAQRVALAHRDCYGRMNETALELGVAASLCSRKVSWSQAKALARQALRETRCILDAVNGKVTRYDPLLDPETPQEVVDAECRALGIDPDALAERGAAFVAKLLEERR